MNQMNNGWNENESDTSTPAELRKVSAVMDRLGERERAAAPAGLEDRLFVASRASLVERPAVIARIDGGSAASGGINGWRFRLAASIMIAAVGVTAAVWMNSRGGVAGPVSTGAASSVTAAELAQQLESDLSAWASETSALASSDTELAALHSSLSEIESDTVSDPWDVIDVSTEEPSL